MLNLICDHPSDCCDCSTSGEECCCIPGEPEGRCMVCHREMYEIDFDSGERAPVLQ